MTDYFEKSADSHHYFTERNGSTDNFIKKYKCVKEQLYKNICLSVVSQVRRNIVLVSIPLHRRVCVKKTAFFLNVEPAQIEIVSSDRLQELIGYPKDLIPFLGLQCEHLLDNDALKYSFIISGTGEKDRYVRINRSFYMNDADLTLGDFVA